MGVLLSDVVFLCTKCTVMCIHTCTCIDKNTPTSLELLRTFLLNRERAIDFLNMQDRIYVFDGFAGWDPTVSTDAYITL